jgi:hypothetical protein
MNDDFKIGPFETEDEALFACNVAACAFEGPDVELNRGLNLTPARKHQIEREVLGKVADQIDQIGGEVLIIDPDTREGLVINMSTLKRVRRITWDNLYER